MHHLLSKYRKIKNLNAFEQCYYSQNGEDGIIQAIFQTIGTTNQWSVEFGIHANEGNTIYLSKQSWTCLWMDGEGDNVTIQREHITAENIESLFAKYHVPQEFDLLSIDLDLNDYWVWKAVVNYSPRVVVIEYNASIPITEKKMVMYDPEGIWDGTNYFGASLLAMDSLGKTKGYTLVACDSKGVNAFFVRNDFSKRFARRTIDEIYRPPGYGEYINGVHTGHPMSTTSMISI